MKPINIHTKQDLITALRRISQGDFEGIVDDMTQCFGLCNLVDMFCRNEVVEFWWFCCIDHMRKWEHCADQVQLDDCDYLGYIVPKSLEDKSEASAKDSYDNSPNKYSSTCESNILRLQLAGWLADELENDKVVIQLWV